MRSTPPKIGKNASHAGDRRYGRDGRFFLHLIDAAEGRIDQMLSVGDWSLRPLRPFRLRYGRYRKKTKTRKVGANFSESQLLGDVVMYMAQAVLVQALGVPGPCWLVSPAPWRGLSGSGG